MFFVDNAAILPLVAAAVRRHPVVELPQVGAEEEVMVEVGCRQEPEYDILLVEGLFPRAVVLRLDQANPDIRTFQLITNLFTLR